MALDPQFFTKPNDGGLQAQNLTVIETNLQVPTQAVTIFTAGANGSLLYEIDAQANATTLLPATLAGLVYLFLFDAGGRAILFDTISVSAITASTTAAPWRATPKQYPEGIPLPTGWLVKAAISVAPTTGAIAVWAYGSDA